MRASVRTLIVLSLFVLAGCASTSLTAVWKNPEPLTPFSKVTVIVMAQEPSMRRIAEDAFVRAMSKDVVGIASYKTFGDVDMKDVEAVKAKVLESGVDGVVLYRLISIDTQTSYVPGTTYVGGYGGGYYGGYHGSFGGYYGYSSAVVYQPGYLVEDKIVQIETHAYRVSGQDLIWTARSETFNPTSAQTLIDDVVTTTVGRMRYDKIMR